MVGVGGKRRTDISAAPAAGALWASCGASQVNDFLNVYIFKSTHRGSHTNLERDRDRYTTRCKETYKYIISGYRGTN